VKRGGGWDERKRGKKKARTGLEEIFSNPQLIFSTILAL